MPPKAAKATKVDKPIKKAVKAAEPAKAEAASSKATEPAKAVAVVMAYCVRCKTKRAMKDPKEAKTSNGRKMMKGTCSVCGTKMNLFVKD